MPRAGGARGRGSGQVPKSKQKAKKVKLITSPKQKPGQQKPKRKKTRGQEGKTPEKRCWAFVAATPLPRPLSCPPPLWPKRSEKETPFGLKLFLLPFRPFG